MAFKNGRCNRCGCKIKEWCYDDDGIMWSVGCERRAAVQRIWLEPGLDESQEFIAQCYKENPEIAERMRPGREGGPPA